MGGCGESAPEGRGEETAKRVRSSVPGIGCKLPLNSNFMNSSDNGVTVCVDTPDENTGVGVFRPPPRTTKIPSES